MWRNVAGKTFLRKLNSEHLGATDWALAVSGCALDMKMGTVIAFNLFFQRKEEE